MAAWYLPLETALRSSKSLKPNNLAKLRITPNRSEQFGVMLRRGKMNLRKQLLLPSAPDLPYNKALPELYDSAKSPEKPSVTRASCPDGVKKLPTRIVSNPSRDGGAGGRTRTGMENPPHFECGASANSATPARRSRHADVPRGCAEHIHYSGSRAKSQAPACGARHFAFLKFYMEMD